MSLDPLLDYINRLKPDVGEVDSFSEWTPSLKAAATTYLVKEMSAEDYSSFLGKLGDSLPTGTRSDQVDFIVNNYQFWDVLYVSHVVILDAIPDLETLIHVVRGIGTEEIAEWLHRNASYEQRTALLRAFDADDSPPEEESDWWIFDYGDWLRTRIRTHKNLLRAWETIIRPEAPTKPTLDTRAIRAWATEQGHKVGKRGRLRLTIIQKYAKEQKTD